MTKDTCSFEGCERDFYARTYCKPHYAQHRRGEPIRPLGQRRLREPAPVRFWRYVNKTDTCWVWTGTKAGRGYGAFWAGRDRTYAHRWSYEHHVGPIPEGMVIDHICHTPACVRPDHLRVATVKENTEYRRGAQVNNLSSGIRGVHKTGRRWYVQLMHNKERHYFGTFATIAEAEEVAIRERARLFKFPEPSRS